MALYRFFLENQVLANEAEACFALRLSAEDFKHAGVVRLEAGEHIGVVDAAGDYFECEVVRFSLDVLEVRIVERLPAGKPRPTVVLVQGIAKGDKMDQIIRQTTELGISAVVPFAAERCVVKLDEKKLSSRVQRWRSIAKSAAMQSGQLHIAEVSEPKNLKEACAFLAGASVVLIFWEEASMGVGKDVGMGVGKDVGVATIAAALEAAFASLFLEPSDARVALVVGPEGGLTKGEVAALLAANPRAATLSLGASILRSETAAVVASALTLYELGELQ